MKKRTKRLVGGIALAAGALGAAGAFLMKTKRSSGRRRANKRGADVWARPGMVVTFRAELMPGRDRDERSYRVKEFLPSGRVSLAEVAGEHNENEFERLH